MQWIADNPLYRFNSYGVPSPGPDFVRLANSLVEEHRRTTDNTYLEALQSLALHNTWFTLDVQFKASTLLVRFIPGHIWGSEDVKGPTERANVMVIGKMPGGEEARESRNLVGKSGQILVEALQRAGSVPEEHLAWYITNVLKFPHPLPKIGGALPRDWIKDCRPLLHMELRLVLPNFILCLGSESGKELLDSKGSIKNSIGKVFDYKIPLEVDGSTVTKWHTAKLMTCIHPAAVARSPDLQPQLDSSIQLFLRLVRGETVGREETDIEHIVVRSEKEAEIILTRMLDETKTGTHAIAIDCEWQGERPTEPDSWLRTIQLSHKPKFAVCLEMRKCGGEDNLVTSTLVKRLLNKIFESSSTRHIRPVGHFHRADLIWLIHYGLDLRKQFEVPTGIDSWESTKITGGFDTGAAAHSVCETDDYKLEVLATRYTSVPRYDTELQEAKKVLCKRLKIGAEELPGYGDIPDEALYPYANYDVDATRRLFDIYNGIDNKPGLLDFDEYGNNSRTAFWISMRASPACLEMEMTGLRVDRTRSDLLIESYSKSETELIAEIRKLVNWPTFACTSPFDMRELLYGYKLRGQINKATGDYIRKSPPEAKLCNLIPIKTTNKNVKKPWEQLVEDNEDKNYTPATDRESLGILFHTIENKEKAGIVSRLRDLRFIGQLLRTTLRPPRKDKKKENYVLDDTGERIFDKGLLSYVCKDDRIHTNIYQTLETGRYSSARPCLQNMAKRRESDYQRILGNRYLFPMRSVFTASPGYVFIEADYVGAELAGAAWMSNDTNMIEHVKRAQLPENHPDYYDIHSAIAVSAFRLPCPATKKGLASIGMAHLRVAAKNVVFGYMYGRSAPAIQRQAKEEGVDITVQEAQELINGLIRQYPSLPRYFNACRARVNDPGWTCNCFGRMRRFRSATDSKVAGEQERQSMNFGIQSLVADAMSRALDNLYSLRDSFGLHYRILLQIHDAVLLEVPCQEAEAVYDKVLPYCMSDLVPIFPSDLNGMATSKQFYNLGIDIDVCVHWGVKLTSEEASTWGVPTRFVKGKK